jgi:hypothetical protein
VTRKERFEQGFEQTLAEWIDDGASSAPEAALLAAAAHARAHPRRPSGAGLRRMIMDRIQLTEVETGPSRRGWLVAVGVTAALGVLIVGLLGGGILTLGGGPEELPAVGAPATTATPTTTAPATIAPTSSASVAPTSSPSLWAAGTAAAVIGTDDCGVVSTYGDEPSPPPYSLLGHVLACTASANDARVTGPGTAVLNVAGWDPAQGYNAVAWIYREIKGPHGTWAGRAYGLYDNDGVLHVSGFLVGTGAYEGLIFALAGTVASNSSTLDMVGVIQPGTPPPGFPVTSFAP